MRNTVRSLLLIYLVGMTWFMWLEALHDVLHQIPNPFHHHHVAEGHHHHVEDHIEVIDTQPQVAVAHEGEHHEESVFCFFLFYETISLTQSRFSVAAIYPFLQERATSDFQAPSSPPPWG